MRKYKNINGHSGVESYEAGPDYIAIFFKSGSARKYLYTYAATGPLHVENMKKLAADGRGLSAYISKHVKERYAQKIK